MLRIPDFTAQEIKSIKEKANFTEREMRLFCLRNEECTHEQCAEVMNVSPATEYRINRSMMKKVIKVI